MLAARVCFARLIQDGWQNDSNSQRLCLGEHHAQRVKGLSRSQSQEIDPAFFWGHG